MAPRYGFPLILLVTLHLTVPMGGLAQGLPQFAPLNPMASSRSGLYYQPYRESAPGRWLTTYGVDYASVIEYNRLTRADYVLDSEVLRMSVGLSRDLGRRTFLLLEGAVAGAYGGFLDGFLDWYHGALGIRVSERENRPRDRFLYTVTLPDGSSVNRSPRDVFLQDVRVGLGIRASPRVQTVFSATLPTSTGPSGYGRGVPSVAVLNTLRAQVRPQLSYEGTMGLGFTPSHGDLQESQREFFLAVSSGMRWRVWGQQSVFANLFYHSPYYHGTTLPSLDRKELSLDFGWILQTQGGGEWRVGMTEDLEPGGPGVDLIFRVGRSF